MPKEQTGNKSLVKVCGETGKGAEIRHFLSRHREDHERCEVGRRDPEGADLAWIASPSARDDVVARHREETPGRMPGFF